MQRPDIKSIFQGGKLAGSNKNSKQMLMLRSLQWRQAYQNEDHYCYHLEEEREEDLKFELRQILNGEMKGLGTGTFVWPAAHILGKYLEITYGPNRLAGKHVCDIGTGTGLTGFIAAYLGAEVVLTDQSCVMELLSENLDKFSHAVKNHDSARQLPPVHLREYDWNTKEAVSDKPFDLIIVSDCVLPKLYPIDLLLAAVNHLISDHTVALFSYEHRPYPQFDPRQEFHRLCDVFGLSVSVIPLSEHHPVYRAEDIELWEVRRKAASSPSSSSVHDAASLGRRPKTRELLVENWGEDKEWVNMIITGGVAFELSSSVRNEPLPLRIWQSGGSSGIGGVLWPSSVICSRLLLSEKYFPSVVTNSQHKQQNVCLDIGAGCGLTSLVAHRLGYHVLATDRAAIVEGVLQRNLNVYLESLPESSSTGVRPHLSARPFDWEAADISGATASTSNSDSQPALNMHTLVHELLRTHEHVTHVLCSDCLYSSFAVTPLLDLLDHLIIRLAEQMQSSASFVGSEDKVPFDGAVDATSQSASVARERVTKKQKPVQLQILLVNEQRTALEEFLYFAYHRPHPQIKVTIREIPLTTPDLILVRSAKEFQVAPPLRACLCTWSI